MSGSSLIVDDSSTPRPATGNKHRKACANCIKRKVKCSSERPSCKNCLSSGRKCFYTPYEKKISVLLSKYQGMEATISKLKSQLDGMAQLKTLREDLRSSKFSPNTPISSDRTEITSGSILVSGSSDGIVRKLEEMQNHHPIDSKVGNNMTPLQSSSEMKDQIDRCGSIVHNLLKSLSLEEAFQLIDQCHFFLNDIYFPYDVNLMKLKLRRAYRPVSNFAPFLQQEDSYFKPLVLLTFALGKRYFGESNDIIQSLLSYSLLLVTPVTKLKQKKDSYLLVSVYTMASFYFRSINLEEDSIMYSNLSLQYAAHLKLHEFEKLELFEGELKSRIMWVCFGSNRTLSAKMGNPFILSSQQISRPLPHLISYDEDGTMISDINLGHDMCPNESEFRAYIDLTCIAEEICKVIYSNSSSATLTSNLGNIIQRLISWNSTLPDNYRFDRTFNGREKKHKRLICSLHLNYCFCIHLTTIPILYSLVEKKKYHEKALNINENLTELITICVNAAEMTVNVLLSCHKEGALAIFGVMDLDYIYSSSLSFFMCGDVLGLQYVQNRRLLDSCLFLLKEMAKSGNECAQAKYDRLQDLIETYRKQNPKATVKIEPGPGGDQILSGTAHIQPLGLQDEYETLVPESSWFMDPRIVETFQGLTDDDLDIWENGYRNLQQLDSYWDNFQRSLFNGDVM
ncbi:hypothetical protein FOA43_003607 [Brettanomyces nanus]|uniref:Zn(2)-C6 fungal-type domain-containing protein n=1 Tax=Eeniella nana TaxID=13502 RepID=A0A875S3F5_EENNA|nr:uncharacterized protein FOA43_003607 [Brettanomyces nanus]QPG76221.1 hypothetical protein FOA43_003607 [Brettanomyces nanus]